MIYCSNGHKTNVINSRQEKLNKGEGSSLSVIRVRVCEQCGYRVRTAEVPYDLAMEVYSDE